MKDRIRQIIEWANLSQQDFANRLGISPASLSSIFTGRTNPTNNHVQAIHRAFPEINVSWLLFGEGAMMSGDSIINNLQKENESVVTLGEGNLGTESGVMPSMFSDEDYQGTSVKENMDHVLVSARREKNVGRAAGFHFIENAKKNDNKMRKIKEIRVFFDDGTYEAFVPSGGK